MNSEFLIAEWNENRRELFKQRQLIETRNLRGIGLADAAMTLYQARVASIGANLEAVLLRKPELAKRAARLFR
jgi:hypothetical protein